MSSGRGTGVFDSAADADWGMPMRIGLPPDSGLLEHVQAACCLLLLAVLAVFLLCFPYGADQAIFALAARAVLEGGVPYLEVWDLKPPGVFLFYMLAEVCFGGAQVGIRVIELACHAAFGIAAVRLTRGHSGGLPGLIAVTLGLHTAVLMGYWHTAQSETFAGFLVFAAVGVLFPELCNRPEAGAFRRRLVVAGLATGLCGLIKPFHVLPGFLCLAWAIGVRARHAGRAAWHREWPHAALAVLVPPVLVLGFVAVRGGWSEFLETLFTIAPAVHAEGVYGHGFGEMLVHAVRQAVQYFPLPLLVGGVAYAVLARGAGGLDARLLLALFGALLFDVAVQGKLYPYHFQIVVPALAFVSGLGWWMWFHRLASLRMRAALVCAYFAAFFVGTAQHDHLDDSWLESGVATVSVRLVRRAGSDAVPALETWPSAREDLRRVGHYLRQYTGPHEPIQVIGFDPLVYLYADRPCATRFLTTVPIRLASTQADWTPRLLADLHARPPAAIVTVRHDRMPHMLDNNLTGAETLRQRPELMRFLDEHYHLARVLPAHEVFLRNARD